MYRSKEMHAIEGRSSSSLQTPVSRYYGGLITRFSDCGDAVSFIACLDVNERHVNLALAHCPI